MHDPSLVLSLSPSTSSYLTRGEEEVRTSNTAVADLLSGGSVCRANCCNDHDLYGGALVFERAEDNATFGVYTCGEDRSWGVWIWIPAWRTGYD